VPSSSSQSIETEKRYPMTTKRTKEDEDDEKSSDVFVTKSWFHDSWDCRLSWLYYLSRLQTYSTQVQ
jgi:hypothetical protein